MRSRRAAMPGVQLRLDHDASADQMQTAREPQDRRDLRLPAAGPGDGEPGDFILHRCRHRHGPILPCIRKIRSYAAASSSGSCRSGACPVLDRVSSPCAATAASSTSLPTSCLAATVETFDVGHGGLVGQHHVEGEFRGVSGQNLQMTLRGEAIGFARLGRKVERKDLSGLGLLQRLAQLRHQKMRDHGGEPGARAEHHPVGVPHRGDRLGDGRRLLRHHMDGLHLAAGERDGGLAADRGDRVRTVRFMALDLGLEFQGHRRHGQHPAVRAEQLADQVERLDVVAELLPQRDDQQIADRVVVQLALALEAVLDHLGPGLAPVVVAAQRGQRLAQIAGRQDAQLVAEAAAGAAVVGDRDHGGQVTGDAAQRGQRGGQAHASAQGHHLGGGPLRHTAAGDKSPDPAQPWCPRAHSRPMSRWTTTVSTPSETRRRASFSDIATLRCLPPVQPTAMVT